MKFLKTGLLTIACSVVICSPAWTATRIKDNLRFMQLSNGMKVFVYPRNATPLFTGMIYVDAGSAEEQAGATGLAHLLEHMAFKGTPWIGTKDWNKEREILAQIAETGADLTTERQKLSPDEGKVRALSANLAALQKQESELIVPNEYDTLITQEGGQEVNATTSDDFTNYFITMPSNKLEMWAMMESERLLYPSWREFYLERDVVAEERRMRTDDSPIGKLYEDFIAAAFKAHPYHHPVVGWMPDIYNLTIEKTNDFYRRWYVPENMVALLVGDVNVDEARTIMEKYFGSIPASPSPQKAITVEPKQEGERRIQVLFNAQPQLLMGWHKPVFPDRDMYVFEIIQFLMTRTGRTSRLYERLVKKDNLCQEVESSTEPGDKYPNLFMLQLTPRSPHTNAEAEKAALEEIERIKREPVPDEELARIRNQVDAVFLKELESNNGLARKLGYYYLASRDPDILDKMREEMQKVSPQDIMRAAQQYLTDDNRTVAELVTKQTDGESRNTELKPAPKRSAGIKISGANDTGGESQSPTTISLTISNDGRKSQ